MLLARFAFAALLAMTPLAALGQTAKPAADPPKAEAPKKEGAKTDAQREKKPRSEAQQKNDERMRACGKEWRAAKAANKTDGKNWREFSTDCRRKKKAG